MKIAIIDYGVGNLTSVQKALEYLGYPAEITAYEQKIAKADLLVLPGQGAFETAMKNLKKLHLISHLKEHFQKNRPFLGICLGFQLLFERSYENGIHEGLSFFKGEVKPFKFGKEQKLKIPHMGWNSIQIAQDPYGFFKNIKEDSHVYFVHSYFVDTPEEIIATKTTYGQEFVSGIQSKNLLAVQFHPEKSSDLGLKLLDNFLGRALKNKT